MLKSSCHVPFHFTTCCFFASHEVTEFTNSIPEDKGKSVKLEMCLLCPASMLRGVNREHSMQEGQGAQKGNRERNPP